MDIGKPVLGVSIAYRLGVMGFMNSEEVAKEGYTNLGLKDQRLALHWIQENIGAFGGTIEMSDLKSLLANLIRRRSLQSHNLGSERWCRERWVPHPSLRWAR